MPQQEESYSLDAMLEAANIERLDEADRIYSHEVREIISSKPVWIVRNGIAMFFIIIGLLFALTFFIQYPDIIKAPIKMQSTASKSQFFFIMFIFKVIWKI